MELLHVESCLWLPCQNHAWLASWIFPTLGVSDGPSHCWQPRLHQSLIRPLENLALMLSHSSPHKSVFHSAARVTLSILDLA